MADLFNIQGKNAVVVGASSGLGADAARAYAQAGANVAILARRLDRLEDLKAELQAHGVTVVAARCDVTDEASCKEAIDTVIAELGSIDILLNNAGVAVRGGVETLTDDEWDRALDTNVKGIAHVSKYVIGHMKEAGYGRVINIASVNAVIADKNDAFIRHTYNASKAAVVGLTKGMAASYARYGITVNALGPGLFSSEMTANTLFKSEEFLATYSALNPASRPGKTGELNGPILFLSSDACSYVQGQFIAVDGGATIV
ncbi:MAG: SDR family oxidoreductase [Actinomycetaceae bacterium]|nr:SDR family oxidoreductase [Actinomycetaceae bacterium]